MTEQPEEPPTPPHTLTELREEAGLSKRQVATRMGVHHSRVGQIEALYPGVRLHTLVAYMQAIGHQVRFVGTDTDIAADQVGPAANSPGIRAHQARASAKGSARRSQEWSQRPPKN